MGAGREGIIQRMQNEENKLRTQLALAQVDLLDANAALRAAEEQSAKDEEELEALTAQVNYWRQRTYKWMQEARKVI